MAAAPEKLQNNDENTITVRIFDIIQKNRKTLIIAFAAVLVILAGFIIGSAIMDKARTKAIGQVIEFEQRYEGLKYFVSRTDAEAIEKIPQIFTLLEDLAAFQKRNSGLALARSYYLSGDIHADQKNWAGAEAAWAEAARAAKKSYLAPLSFFNAAVAAEERGNTQDAIDFHNSALAFGDSFPAAAKSQFSIGRLEESRGNTAGAVEAYRSLLSKWPNDPYWSNLAQSRLVVLSD
jgi:tetratricopeptide (TPR) repeat protein